MTVWQLIITLAGILAICWVNYYFLFSSGPTVRARSSTGPQIITIEVDGGYSPSRVQVVAGQPVRLDFHRTDRSSCSEELVVPEFGIRKFLPSGETTPVEFTPVTPGSFQFMCGMGMLHGSIVVLPRDAGERS
jgi:plastocyanin domain-containing protein